MLIQSGPSVVVARWWGHLRARNSQGCRTLANIENQGVVLAAKLVGKRTRLSLKKVSVGCHGIGGRRWRA